MTDIYIHGKQIESIFELLGDKENDVTYSIGWALANSRAFLNSFLECVFPGKSQDCGFQIRLQEREAATGITDIEIRGDLVHIIVEAKRGWSLPGNDQLSRYAKRLRDGAPDFGCIVCMSECSPQYAALHLPETIQAVPVKYFSWKDVANLTRSLKHASHAERRLLEQLRIYLRRIVNMQNQLSNMVYVVSLGSAIPDGCSISWIDIVETKMRYFHPVGNNWPVSPPNYIGFRYRGKLQSVHHIESWKMVDDLHSEIKEIGAGLWDYPHFCYRLGPAIVPEREVRSGKVYPNGRVWAMLDLLLTSSTVSDARDQTNKRLAGDA